MEITNPHSVRELVSSFSPDERKMLMLHWAEEMTPREIEQVLGLPEDAVSETLANIKSRTEWVMQKTKAIPARRKTA